jgi:hypothetical protein
MIMTPLTLEEIKNNLPFQKSNGKWVLPIYLNERGELGGYNYNSEIDAVRAHKVLIKCKERDIGIELEKHGLTIEELNESIKLYKDAANLS